MQFLENWITSKLLITAFPCDGSTPEAHSRFSVSVMFIGLTFLDKLLSSLSYQWYCLTELCGYLCKILVWPRGTLRSVCIWGCDTVVALRVTRRVVILVWHMTLKNWSCDTETQLTNSGLIWDWPLHCLWKCRGFQGKVSTSQNGS